MPYIPKEDRERAEMRPETQGELTYAICNLINIYCHNKGMTYDTLNEISGSIHNAYQEWYRRVAAPYEDAKRQQNGDVF